MMVGLILFTLSSMIYLMFINLKSMIYFINFSMILLMGLCLFNYQDSYSLEVMNLYLDSMSTSLVILSIWVSLLMIVSSYKIIQFNEYSKTFSLLIYILMEVLIITFYVGNYLLFYFFFEISLIPTLLIILGWGYQPERLQAGVYFIFYTLTASLPLLLGILYNFTFGFDLSFWSSFSSSVMITSKLQSLLALIMILAFLVKLPMYATHLWLPKAHVEAPVAGSMILAGVLLKLGGYGLIRVNSLIYYSFMKFNNYIIGLSLVGMTYVGLICCRLNDFKALVAYSSVAHMAMVICGCMSLFNWGYEGSLAMMIGHGISSSGLFCIVNMYYERLGSRSFYINKGLLLIFPIFSLSIFLLSAANIAAPPSINLFSEIFLMGSIMSFDTLMFLVFPVGSFLGAVFTIFMFSYSQHGKIYYLSYSLVGNNIRESHVLFMHIIPVNLIILNPSLFLMV
uniref:NADH-ubiquinone oxidoreductase chain 4 n=1 Tax=Cryptopygus terranovus TaxID=1906390 RepID=A0A343A7X9_9HEXA|nr:NADH dehydrogenase subunit 4 [Cryptopygus terranovus]APC61724.1 NADH dehydrogenase subunit 4 [Cryptopygus terranovus]